jgi:cytidylate kinase
VVPVLDPSATAFRGVVALDGPSGTGKSTVARALARRLGARYLDTGAMYRAATVAALDAGAALADDRAIAAAVDAAQIEITTDPESTYVAVDGRPVGERIRSAEITAAVSAVAAVAAVRTRLVAQQRALIGTGGIVVEGRDIGTVVWPQAVPKVYLTADAAERARRRADQTGVPDVAGIQSGLARRDRLDSQRAVSPLLRAADAVELDTTSLDIDTVVERLVELTARRQFGAASQTQDREVTA